MNEFHQFIEYHYCVLCSLCGSKVMDPDKSNGQVYLKGKCPTCGKSSSQVKNAEKAERKRLKKIRQKEQKERRRQERKERKLAARGK